MGLQIRSNDDISANVPGFKATNMNFERIYNYRFQGIDAKKKKIVWNEISRFISDIAKKPHVILDPAAGQCEFINAIPGKEKWAVDMNEVFIKKHVASEIKVVIGNIL